MLRLDPGEGRVRTARTFRAWEGGGEYNVARGLRRCFGMRTALVSAFADNEVGRLLEDLILTGGVDTSLVKWVPYDGIGRTVRNGLNFTERGFGVRGAVGVSDRGHTAASQLRPDDVDWEHLFGTLGVRWLHTGGIYAALSETTPDVIEAAMAAGPPARHGHLVRPELPPQPVEGDRRQGAGAGGQPAAGPLRRRDDRQRGGLHRQPRLRGARHRRGPVRAGGRELREDDRPGRARSTTTSRSSPPRCARCAARRSTTGARSPGADGGFAHATHRPGLEILDRVGGGDSFASGLIYGLLTTGDLATRGRVRRRPRRAGDDHARRHLDGHPRRGRGPDARRRRRVQR